MNWTIYINNVSSSARKFFLLLFFFWTALSQQIFLYSISYLDLVKGILLLLLAYCVYSAIECSPKFLSWDPVMQRSERKRNLPCSKDLGSADESQTSADGLWQCIIVFRCKIAGSCSRAFEKYSEKLNLYGQWLSKWQIAKIWNDKGFMKNNTLDNSPRQQDWHFSRKLALLEDVKLMPFISDVHLVFICRAKVAVTVVVQDPSHAQPAPLYLPTEAGLLMQLHLWWPFFSFKHFSLAVRMKSRRECTPEEQVNYIVSWNYFLPSTFSISVN